MPSTSETAAAQVLSLSAPMCARAATYAAAKAASPFENSSAICCPAPTVLTVPSASSSTIVKLPVYSSRMPEKDATGTMP